MGCATGVADTLRCLELDMARHQDRIEGSTAHFLCGYPFSDSDHSPFRRLCRASGIIAAAWVRLFGAWFYWRSNVRRQLRSAFLGRAARFIRSGRGVAGDDPNFRHAFRALDASGRTTAAGQASRRTCCGRRCCRDLSAPSRLQRLHGFLGRAGHYTWSCQRRVFERVTQSPRNPIGSSDDCRMANDFRRRPFAFDWVHSRRESDQVSLERDLDFLSALSRDNRLGAHVSPALLVATANDSRTATNNLADHATRRSGIRLGNRRRNIFNLVAAWRVPGARWRVDNFPKRGRAGTRDPGGLVRQI